MTTTTKKTSTKGIRYSDEQKKEIVDFVNTYNSQNGRGGQSKAAEKYNVSQLTISTWLKGASSPKAAKVAKAPKAPKAAKVAKAPKAEKAAKAVKAPKAKKVAKAPKAKKAGGKGRVGTRYTDEQKKEVIDFALAYNAANGRGGQSRASAKFNVSPLTVVTWLKAAGAPAKVRKVRGPGKKNKATAAPKAAATKVAGTSNPSNMSSKLSSLLSLSNQIARSENELAQLKAKFASIKASL